jgi:hypothetical protein
LTGEKKGERISKAPKTAASEYLLQRAREK